jgi:hypothetical protein
MTVKSLQCAEPLNIEELSTLILSINQDFTSQSMEKEGKRSTKNKTKDHTPLAHDKMCVSSMWRKTQTINMLLTIQMI